MCIQDPNSYIDVFPFLALCGCIGEPQTIFYLEDPEKSHLINNICIFCGEEIVEDDIIDQGEESIARLNLKPGGLYDEATLEKYALRKEKYPDYTNP